MSGSSIAYQNVTLAGVTPAFVTQRGDIADLAFGPVLTNRFFLIVVNDTTQDVTLTILTDRECSQGSEHPDPVTIPADGKTYLVGPFPPSRFTDKDDDKVHISLSGVLDQAPYLKLAALNLA